MKLLVIDTSYTFKAIKEKKLHNALYSRNLNGYFEKVWSVHPFASIISNFDQKVDENEVSLHNIRFKNILQLENLR